MYTDTCKNVSGAFYTRGVANDSWYN